MKIFTSINEDKSPIYQSDINVSWDNNFKDIINELKDIAPTYVEMMKNRIQKSIEDFYDKNPRKLNAQGKGEVKVLTCIDKNDPSMIDLNKIYSYIGMDSGIRSLDGISLASYQIKATGRGKKNPIKIDIDSRELNEYKLNDNIPGNGYNELSGSIIKEYRDKLISIIKKTKILVSLNEYSNTININIIPIIKKQDAKRLIEEIIHNGDLIEYGIKLHGVNDKLTKYYLAKSSGEYIGD